MRDGVRARSPEARVHDGEEGWGEGFVAREPHTETITLSLDYGAALSPPGSLWSTRRLDNSILVRADRRVIRAHTMENLKPKVCNSFHQQRIPSP